MIDERASEAAARAFRHDPAARGTTASRSDRTLRDFLRVTELLIFCVGAPPERMLPQAAAIRKFPLWMEFSAAYWAHRRAIDGEASPDQREA